MTWICVVRHGETEWNRLGRIEDIPLNTTGEMQAERCGRYLAQETWDVLISSPLQRARKTADLIDRFVDAALRYEMDEVHERDCGAASGLTFDERMLKFPSGPVPGMEPRSELTARAMQALQLIAEKHAGKRIIVVSHGGLINAMLSHISHGTLGTGTTRLENACINHLVYQHDHWNILAFNSVDHLS